MKCTVGDGAAFTTERGFRMDLALPAGELNEATMSDYRRKDLLVDVTYAELQAAAHLQRGSTPYQRRHSRRWIRGSIKPALRSPKAHIL